tara:strand:- start:708 stop:893 length:186 start_codon:yes stop_codon:yes gene_type:complete
VKIVIGEFLAYDNLIEDLNVVIGFDGKSVKLYEVSSGEIMTFTIDFVRHGFSSYKGKGHFS